MLKLHKSIKFNAYIQRVKMPRAKLQPLARVTAIGLGLDRKDGNPNDDLHFAEMKHISQEECNKANQFVARGGVFCARGIDRGSPCPGDNGGPLVVQTEEGAILVGVSRFNHHKGCDLGRPATFSSGLACTTTWNRSITQ